MDLKANPFYEVYVGEKLLGKDFVQIFSPSLIRHAQGLFGRDNIVLKGVQGSGKSMLLRLLQPEFRVAYAESDEEFPVPAPASNFIGAGINLNLSRAIEFSLRQIYDKGEWMSPFYFADFVNYWVSRDILNSIEVYSRAVGGKIAHELGIDFCQQKIDSFVRSICSDDCWFGAMNDVTTYDAFKAALSDRILTYRSYFQFNIDDIPETVRRTKTTMAVPFTKVVECLWQSGIVPQSTPFFIQIDQYEELCRLEAGAEVNAGRSFRQMLNRAIAYRCPSVYYRIGTRNYAWENELNTYAYKYKLEERRDYTTIDLNQKLRRRENRKTWIFPDFAEEVFERRLKFAGFDVNSCGGLLKKVLGEGLPPEAKAARYGGKSPGRAIKLDEGFPDWWAAYLRAEVRRDPLSARLAEAWSLQQAQSGGFEKDVVDGRPWASRSWWRKERIPAALMQIAGRCSETQIWSGRDEILDLSGGNILIFLSLCQSIWSMWLQVNRVRGSDLIELEEIDPDVQSYGVQETSALWIKKISEESGGCGDRLAFIQYVGQLLHRRLFNDRPLSNPGNNGFSIENGALELSPAVKAFLNDLSDYGNLVELDHTTKMSDKKSRTKWYLNPIYCPYFKIHYQRTKEPIYTDTKEVEYWIRQSRLPAPVSPMLTEGDRPKKGGRRGGGQLDLFGKG